MVAAFQVLLSCLEENEAVQPGQFPAALAVYVEMVKSREGDVSDMTLAVLHDIRIATLDSLTAAVDQDGTRVLPSVLNSARVLLSDFAKLGPLHLAAAHLTTAV